MSMKSSDLTLLVGFGAVLLLLPLLNFVPLGPLSTYNGLLIQFAIFALFAVGFNILFGLTGYLSFGHAAFIGVGSYTAVWSFKLLSMQILPALLLSMLMGGLFALVIGFICLRRSGIYFSILTLAFAQMAYSLAYSVLTPITNGETALQLDRSDPRILSLSERTDALPSTDFFGVTISGGHELEAYYLCAAILFIGFLVAVRIFRSPYGLKLKAIKSNQTRMNYTGFNTKPYLLSAFVISGIYAGLAGGLMAAVDPLAEAERMYWTKSGEVVLMSILGGLGTLLGPVIGATLLKYCENILSAINHASLEGFFSFLPEPVAHAFVSFFVLFVGEGWHLSVGALFMVVVIFLPGGMLQGLQMLGRKLGLGKAPPSEAGPSEGGL